VLPSPEQVVVVVGDSSGIGRASALAFAGHGARVVCAARGTAALDSLVAEIGERFGAGRALAVTTDVADPGSVRALAATAQGRFGRIDTWVNAAAVSVWARTEDVTDAEFDQVCSIFVADGVSPRREAIPAVCSPRWVSKRLRIRIVA
jgi:NAD(P)-dependent dehydrogenase (short-subunit alcohol dehydrogenase family)